MTLCSIMCFFFFFFWSQSVCYFFAISEVMKWFMVLLELKSTQTIQNCEQSLLLLRGKTPRHLCFSKTHRGSIPVWKCNGCVFHPRVKFIQTDFQGDRCIPLAGTRGWPPERMVCPLLDTGHLCVNIPHTGNDPVNACPSCTRAGCLKVAPHLSQGPRYAALWMAHSKRFINICQRTAQISQANVILL